MKFVKSTLFRIALVWVAIVIAAQSSLAQTEILTRELQIVDASDQPIADAVINPLVVNERYFWPSQQVPHHLALSDSNGVASIRYPKVAHDTEILVESIKLTVSHADYCSEEVVVPVEPREKPFLIKLKPGISLSIDAVDEDGQPLTEPFAVILAGESSNLRFNRPAPNRAQCRSIKSGNQQIMLVQPRDDGLHRFSEAIAYHFDLDKEPLAQLEQVEMRPGISVRGTLANTVDRPITNGRVIAVHVPLPAGHSRDEKLPSLIYYDSTTIDKEGNFQFASMPHSGVIQLIALCDGWVGLQDEKTPFIVGQKFDVDDKPLDVVLELKPTFDAIVRVVDKNSKPVQGVTVASSPNQQMQKAGSTFLGQRMDSIVALREQLKAKPSSSLEPRYNVYQGVSDKDGKLTIRNLPRDNRWSERYSVWSEQDKTIKVNEDATGKLPQAGEKQVEFDLVIEYK